MSITYTESQKIAISHLLAGRNVFLTGKAGTGKSFVVQHFLEDMVGKHKNVLVCAPTGIAALNVNGVTIHRAFKAPLEPITLKEVSRVHDVIANADIIVIDEISMCRIDLFDYVSKCIFKAEEERKKWIQIETPGWKSRKARIQLIVVGDFFQLPPVLQDKDKELLDDYYEYDIGSGFAFYGECWDLFNFVTVSLTEVVRQKDPIFISGLNQARVGNASCIDFFNNRASKMPLEHGIVLTATNKRVREINERELSKIDSEEIILEARETGEVRDSDRPTEKILRLKNGCRIMIIVNDPYNKYQNGSIGTLIDYDEIERELVIALDNKSIVRVVRNRWNIEDSFVEMNEKTHKKVLRKKTIGTFEQFPVKLAFAISIHKSQGQTFEEINLEPYCWAGGQLYVALSRATSLSGLHLLKPIQKNFLICDQSVFDFYCRSTGFKSINCSD